MDCFAVTMDLFIRNGGPENPCKRTSLSEMYTKWKKFEGTPGSDPMFPLLPSFLSRPRDHT